MSFFRVETVTAPSLKIQILAHSMLEEKGPQSPKIRLPKLRVQTEFQILRMAES